MPELTKSTGIGEYVDDPNFNFGTVGPEDTIDYEFDFKKSVADLEYIEKGCGCTSAYFMDGKIKGQLDIAKAGQYQDGDNTVSKYVFVWLNDGQPRFMADTVKQKVANPEKKWFKVQVHGTVTK
jgi:hypothetical protein